MSVTSFAKKGLSATFNAAKTTGRGLKRAFNSRAAGIALDVGFGVFLGVSAVTTGGIVLPVIAAVGAACWTANLAIDLNDWRKDHKAKKSAQPSGPS